MLALTVFTVLAVVVLLVGVESFNQRENKEYQVEINRIYQEIEEYAKDMINHNGKGLADRDFLRGKGYTYVKALSYLKEGQGDEKAFFEGKKAVRNSESYVLPLPLEVKEYDFVRFEYLSVTKSYSYLLPLLFFVIAVLWLMTMLVLFWVQHSILKPFHKVEQLPYELSKGHFSIELKESKYRYFGKFMWGLDALRETLKKNHARQLELEKEKKMLILSVSHDIKTPLSSIYLYTKALKENLYEEEKRQQIYETLESKSEQIESFIAEIERMSTQDLLDLPVSVQDCYASEFMEPIEKIYKEKFCLYHTNFVMEPYPNKLVKVDKDRVIEVLENLLENAIKYGDGKSLTISSTEEEYCLLITVTNSGTPVDKTEVLHLFESFWRGSNAGKHRGSGLGLYICKEIMTKMGGDIYASIGENSMGFTLVIREV